MRSIARQFEEVGLRVILVDVSGLSDTERVNLAHNWHLEDIPLFGNPTEIDTLGTILFDQGSLQSHWDGLVLPSELALALQEILN